MARVKEYDYDPSMHSVEKGVYQDEMWWSKKGTEGFDIETQSPLDAIEGWPEDVKRLITKLLSEKINEVASWEWEEDENRRIKRKSNRKR